MLDNRHLSRKMKYDESWKSYWTPYLRSRILRDKLWYDPGVRADYSAIKSYFYSFQGKLILDAGCGAGRVSALLAKEGARTVCVDIVIDACKLAKKMHSDLSIETDAVVSDIRFLPFRKSTFNIVYAGGTIEHISKPEEALREFARVTNSYVVLSVPNIFSYHFIYQRIMCKLGFSHYETMFWVRRIIRLADAHQLQIAGIYNSREDMGLPYFLTFSTYRLLKKIGCEKFIKYILQVLARIFPSLRLGYAFLIVILKKI